MCYEEKKKCLSAAEPKNLIKTHRKIEPNIQRAAWVHCFGLELSYYERISYLLEIKGAALSGLPSVGVKLSGKPLAAIVGSAEKIVSEAAAVMAVRWWSGFQSKGRHTKQRECSPSVPNRQEWHGLGIPAAAFIRLPLWSLGSIYAPLSEPIFTAGLFSHPSQDVWSQKHCSYHRLAHNCWKSLILNMNFWLHQPEFCHIMW